MCENKVPEYVKDATYTYCNPLPIPNIPYADDMRMIKHAPVMYDEADYSPKEVADYRSISDPTVFFYDNKWYLYPSYGMAWVTEDFQHWEHKRTTPYCPKYSPCITTWGDKFLLTSWGCPLYVADNPLGPFELLGDYIMPDGTHFVPIDPAIFTDDDGRIYMYAYEGEPLEGKGIHNGKTIGYELDKENPRQVVRGPVDLFKMNTQNHPWERNGFYNQDTRFGWIEGQHMLKYRGRYYAIYATPGTSFGTYCMAVYYSDEGPLDGFKPQKRNPLTLSKHGIVSGAGHGCVERGPNDTLWAFYTIATPYTHKYERRIGMDLVAVDENGELYCPHGVTQMPQYVPGYMEDPVKCNDPGYLPLNVHYWGTATSHNPGRDAIYAFDDNNISFWEPDPSDPRPAITSELNVPYYVGAVRLFWHDGELCYREGRVPGPIQYILEGHWNGEWFTLLDRSENTEELNIDYQTFPPVSCDQVRLTIVGKPEGINPGLIDFTVFGTRDMER